MKKIHILELNTKTNKTYCGRNTNSVPYSKFHSDKDKASGIGSLEHYCFNCMDKEYYLERTVQLAESAAGWDPNP